MSAPANDKAGRGGTGRSERRNRERNVRGLGIPWLRVTADGRATLCVPRRTFHTAVFGVNLVALVRIMLARFTEQDAGTAASCLLLVVPIAFGLSKWAGRMKDRTPRLCTSSLSCLTLTLHLLPGTLTLAPTATVNQLSICVIALLAFGTGVGELLHRVSDRPKRGLA